MKSSKYWERRIANDTWSTYNNLEEKNRALLEMYQEASLSIADELYRVTEKMKTATPTLSDMHKYNRLTGLQKNMENIIGDLGEAVQKFYINNATEGFKDVYKNVRVMLGDTEFSEVPKRVMEQLLRKQWEGSNFSKRLWKNTQVLVNNLNDILLNGLIQGKTVTEMAIQLNNRMNEGFNVCHRLIRTETMHYLNESAKRAYKDSGCEEVQIWAAVDERTCKVCGSKHGNIYRLKDCPTLPLHANCRCTILPVIDKEDAKNDYEKAKSNIKDNFNGAKGGYKYNKDGTIVVTDNHKGEHFSIPKKYKPYSVVETSSTKNEFVQIDRTIYDKDGFMVRQIHSGNHNRPKQHKYGSYGEHVHIFKWDKDGKIILREVKELSKRDRVEHKDILERK